MILPLELIEKILSNIDNKRLWSNFNYVNDDFHHICYDLTKKRFNHMFNILSSKYKQVYNCYIVKSLLECFCVDDYNIFEKTMNLFKEIFIKDFYLYKPLFVMIRNYHILNDNIEQILFIIPFLLKYSDEHNATTEDIMKNILLMSKFFKRNKISHHLSLKLGTHDLNFNIDDIKSNTDKTLDACKFVDDKLDDLYLGISIDYLEEFESLDLYIVCRNILIHNNNLTGLFFLISCSELTRVGMEDLIIALQKNSPSICTLFLYCILFMWKYEPIDNLYYHRLDNIDMTEDNRNLIDEFKLTFGGNRLDSFHEEDEIYKKYDDDDEDVANDEWQRLFEITDKNKESFLINKLKVYGIDVKYLYEVCHYKYIYMNCVITNKDIKI